MSGAEIWAKSEVIIGTLASPLPRCQGRSSPADSTTPSRSHRFQAVFERGRDTRKAPCGGYDIHRSQALTVHASLQFGASARVRKCLSIPRSPCNGVVAPVRPAFVGFPLPALFGGRPKADRLAHRPDIIGAGIPVTALWKTLPRAPRSPMRAAERTGERHARTQEP